MLTLTGPEFLSSEVVWGSTLCTCRSGEVAAFFLYTNDVLKTGYPLCWTCAEDVLERAACSLQFIRELSAARS